MNLETWRALAIGGWVASAIIAVGLYFMGKWFDEAYEIALELLKEKQKL